MTNVTEIITTADLQSAGGVLTQNTGWVEAYRKKYDALIAQVAAAKGGKLSPELDEKINAYLVSSKTALNRMESERKPYTQKAQEFVKLFTNLENTLGKELYTPLQAARDASAKIYAQEEKQRQLEEQKKLAKDQERIQLIADAEGQVRNAYADILATDKGQLLEAFQGADAETIDAIVELLSSVEATFKVDRWEAITPVVTSHHGNDIENIIANAKAGKYDAVATHYKKEIQGYASHLLSLIPERRQEIIEGQESAAAAALRQQQADSLAKQQADADRRAEEKKAQEMRKAQMDVQIEQANRKHSAPKGRSIESYSITVENRDGWVQIFQMYYTNSGVEELGKIKLDQMKAWCEKYAKSNGEFIEHPSISYDEKYKAVATARTGKKMEVAS